MNQNLQHSNSRRKENEPVTGRFFENELISLLFLLTRQD